MKSITRLSIVLIAISLARPLWTERARGAPKMRPSETGMAENTPCRCDLASDFVRRLSLQNC